jgi:hypothetical protein
MSLWQYQACVDGYNQHHDPRAEGRITEEEADALWQALEVS